LLISQSHPSERTPRDGPQRPRAAKPSRGDRIPATDQRSYAQPPRGGRGRQLHTAALVGCRSEVRVLGSASLRADTGVRLRASSRSESEPGMDRGPGGMCPGSGGGKRRVWGKASADPREPRTAVGPQGVGTLAFRSRAGRCRGIRIWVHSNGFPRSSPSRRSAQGAGLRPSHSSLRTMAPPLRTH
jgi:hypothetical protein